MAGTAFPTGSLGSGCRFPAGLPALPNTATPNSKPQSDNWAKSICLYTILSPGYSRCSPEALAEVETTMSLASTVGLYGVVRELVLDLLLGKVSCYLSRMRCKRY